MTSYSEITKLDKAAIIAKVKDLRTELFKLKMQKVTTGAEKPHLFKQYKKDIARLLTALSEKK